MTDGTIPLRRKLPAATGRTCICGATWRPGPTSDPAWLLTANPELRTFEGVLTCHCCGRWKLDVIREQAEQARAAKPPAIVIHREERPPAPVADLGQRRRALKGQQ